MTAETMTQTAASGKSLQEMIVESAMVKVGESWPGLCGDFVRKVLSEQGVSIDGRLRSVGKEISPDKRQAGDVVFFYDELESYSDNNPFNAAILTGTDSFVGKKGLSVMQCSIQVCEVNGQYFASIDAAPRCEYVRIRRVGY